MRILSPIARPVFAWNHHRLMDGFGKGPDRSDIIARHTDVVLDRRGEHFIVTVAS